MRDLTKNLIDESQRYNQESPWIWLVEMTLDVTVVATVKVYLTNFEEQVVFPASASGNTYHAFPIQIGMIEQDNQSTIPQVSLTVSNYLRTFAQYLEIGKGLMGSDVKLTLVHKDRLTDPLDAISQTFTIRGTSVDEEWVQFNLQIDNMNQLMIPFEIFMRDRCRWVFGGKECAFRITTTSYQTCNKTLEDCILRGVEEGQNKQPVLHPRRYGGFPGIPKKVR